MLYVQATGGGQVRWMHAVRWVRTGPLLVAVVVALVAMGAGYGGGSGKGFGAGGRVRTDFGARDAASAVAVQRDGRIVAVGTSRGNFALARYTASGALDRSFGQGGKVLTDFGGNDAVYAVAIQPDGRIVVAGTGRGAFALARYTRRGRLDTSFGTGGRVRTTVFEEEAGSPAGAGEVAVQPDGRILVGGQHGQSGALVRYLPGGQLDSSFGRAGRVQFRYDDYSYASALALQADGRIVVAVDTAPHGYSFLVRLTPRGDIDLSFGGRGQARFSCRRSCGFVSAVAIDPNGKIVAGGVWMNYDVGPGEGIALARYTRSGRLDPAFGSGGVALTANSQQGHVSRTDLVLQSDGRIITAGLGQLARFLPDGRRDPGFGKGGMVSTLVSVAVALQPDGKIVVAGGKDESDFVVIRYKPDGTLDS